MVTAKNTTHTITRNESYFKWFNGVIPTRQTIVNSLPYLFIQPVSLLIERITPPPLTPTEPATPSTTQPPRPFTQQTQNKSKNAAEIEFEANSTVDSAFQQSKYAKMVNNYKV